MYLDSIITERHTHNVELNILQLSASLLKLVITTVYTVLLYSTYSLFVLYDFVLL